MRWLLPLALLVLASSCCRSRGACAPAAGVPVPVDERAAFSNSEPAPQAETPHPWEPGAPFGTHVASWDCAMPGPDAWFLAARLFHARYELVGRVTRVLADRKRVVVALDPGVVLAVGNGRALAREAKFLGGGQVEALSNGRAVLIVAFEEEELGPAWIGVHAARARSKDPQPWND